MNARIRPPKIESKIGLIRINIKTKITNTKNNTVNLFISLSLISIIILGAAYL